VSSFKPDAKSSQVENGLTHVVSTNSGAQSTISVGAPGLPGASVPPAVGGRMRDIWLMLTRNRKVDIGAILLIFFVLVAILGPLFVRTDPNTLDVGPILAPPSTQFLFGTTQTGQNIFTQTIVSTRSSMLWGFLTALMITAFSTTIGLIAGYFGGTIDDILSILINVFLVIPGLPLAIVLAAFFPKGDLTVAFVLTVTSWSWNARVIRAQTMSMRNRDFVQAAQSSGEGTLHIIFAEILPNEVAIVMSGFIGTVVYVILAAAGLQFLGLGNVTSLSWGGMLYWVNNNDAILQGAYWWFVPPTLCIALVGAALSLINFGVDEIADPRLRNEIKSKVSKAKKVVA
jgi:peptide/nickel transport system permease protein